MLSLICCCCEFFRTCVSMFYYTCSLLYNGTVWVCTESYRLFKPKPKPVVSIQLEESFIDQEMPLI